MSKTDPIFGIDCHPKYQPGFDFARAKQVGMQFAFVKVSQGSSYVPEGFKDYFGRLKASGLIPGAYHFLDESASAKAQAQHFLKTVGGVDGKLVAVDFESYESSAGTLSPTNATVKAFIAELRREIGEHPIILYSGQGFWNGGVPSGSFGQYGADVAWDAYYLDMNRHDKPQDYYDQIKGRGWGERWGGVEPMFWQFTSTGLVAGQYVDVDAYRGTREQLLALTKSGAAPASLQPPKPPSPGGSSLPDYVTKPLAYLEKCEDGPYIVWKSGHFKDGPPAWVANASPPPASEVRTKGGFCASMLNLACRVNSLHIFSDTAISWAGGVKWWGERILAKKIAKKFDASKSYPPGTLFLRRYAGADLARQGHVAIMGRHGRLLQADFFGDGRDGINENRGLRETNDLLKKHDGGGFEYYVLAEGWLK